MRIHRPRPLRRTPRVTVVIPHFNYGRYLPAAVRSALDQPGLELEVIIVDDRSTDGSLETARRIAASDPRIALVEHDRNLRHIRTYNDGLSRATGDYVVLLSADDALVPHALTRAVALMEAHPEVGLVYGAVRWFDGEPPEAEGGLLRWQIWPGEEWIGRIARRGRNAVVNPEVVMRRSVYAATNGYDPDFPHAGDMYMWLQAAAKASVGYVAGPQQAYYRDHGANMHATEFAGALDDMEQVRDVYRRFFARDGAAVPGAERMRRTAMRAVAREALLRGVLLAGAGAPSETVERLRGFASETCPDIVGSGVWRYAGAAREGRPAPRLMRAGERLRWSVRSRRHRLVGL